MLFSTHHSTSFNIFLLFGQGNVTFNLIVESFEYFEQHRNNIRRADKVTFKMYAMTDDDRWKFKHW